MGIMVPQGARRPNKGGTREIGKVSPHLVWSTSIKGTGGDTLPALWLEPNRRDRGAGVCGAHSPILCGAQ